MDYQIIDHGIEHEQYFQGCGVAFTPYTDCYTGVGDTFTEAFEDAMDQIGMDGRYDPDTIVQWLIDTTVAKDPWDNGNDMTTGDNPDIHYYVSIQVKA